MNISATTYKKLSLDRVLVMDLETTGLDPERDEILEIGIVRMDCGKITARYEQLLDPLTPIPDVITRLTGITNEECRDKPTLKEVFFDVVDFLKDGLIVAHNVRFDLEFLNRSWIRLIHDDPPISEERVIDTLELSRILLPQLTTHRLGYLAEFFGIDVRSSHRALADAEVTAFVFRELINLSLTLNRRIVSNFLKIIGGDSDGLAIFFKNLNTLAGRGGDVKKRYGRGWPSNRLGLMQSRTGDENKAKITNDEIDDLFKRDGILSRIVSNYEFRRPQHDMARVVAGTLNQDGFLIAEAGTGVGKSFAYSIPSILWVSKNRGERVVISTHTRNLQEQLFYKDLPLLFNTGLYSFSAVILKGRANYICLRRFRDALANVDSNFSSTERRRLLPLVIWIEETQMGDIEENGGFSVERNRRLWSKIQCDASFCRAPKCEFEMDCFFQKIRRSSHSASIIIVNHSLLFSDMVSEHRILGEYDTLIIDEAHQIEKSASSTVGESLTSWELRDLCTRLYSRDDEAGIIGYLMKIIKREKRLGRRREELIDRLNTLMKICTNTLSDSDSLFREVDRIVTERLRSNEIYKKLRLRKPDDLAKSFQHQLASLEMLIAKLMDEVLNLLSTLNELNLKNIDESIFELEAIRKRAESLFSVIRFLREGDYSEHVVWCEIVGSDEKRYSKIYCVPLKIADILSSRLYPGLKRCIMTSATLSIGGNFDYIIKRLGLDSIEQDRLTLRAFGSPFDFSQQVALIIPSYLSDPREETFSRDVAVLLEELLSIHSHGTMVLFTSHKMLRDVYYKIRPGLEGRNIKLLAQGIDGSRSLLLQMFQSDRNSVLFGTNSFWEGVDVPGEALELLIITKIPFDVPTEPIVEAKIEKCRLETGDGFMNYTLPEAVVRFRQGFGRLIRSSEDRGAILILDRRIFRSGYGEIFLDSIPVKPIICNKQTELLTTLGEWFDS